MGVAGAAGGQLFTPGLAAENQFATQQQVGTGYYGQQPEPDYINAPGYGQQPPMGYAGQPAGAPGQVDQLANQFGQMGVGAGGGQKPYQVYTTNLLTARPDPRDLALPPPEIHLPPGSCLTNAPHGNAHYSYQRTTVNAFPTTSSLANKAKIPLALVINPYKSVKEGEEPVPLVTDTIIARCRRCRTYINPYVQFIDGGNRCVLTLISFHSSDLVFVLQLAMLYVLDVQRSAPALRLGSSSQSASRPLGSS